MKPAVRFTTKNVIVSAPIPRDRFITRMESRAGEGIRTPDVQLGKLAFYH